MIRDIKDSMRAYINAFSQISTFGLWKYLFLSGIVSVLAGGAILYASMLGAGFIGDWLISFYKWNFGSGIISNVTHWVSRISFFILVFIMFKYLVLIIQAPILSMVSEKIETQLSGQKKESKFSLTKTISDLLRGIRLSLRNLSRELLLTIGLIILGMFPLFTLFVTPLIFIVQAYFLGFGNMDFYLERHLSVKESSRFVSRYKGLAIGNGSLFTLTLFIPIVGLFLAPMLSTISATVESHKRLTPELDLPDQSYV